MHLVRRYSRRAAEGGVAAAQALLGAALFTGSNGLEADMPAAVQWLGKAAAAGNSDATEYLKLINEEYGQRDATLAAAGVGGGGEGSKRAFVDESKNELAEGATAEEAAQGSKLNFDDSDFDEDGLPIEGRIETMSYHQYRDCLTIDSHGNLTMADNQPSQSSRKQAGPGGTPSDA